MSINRGYDPRCDAVLDSHSPQPIEEPVQIIAWPVDDEAQAIPEPVEEPVQSVRRRGCPGHSTCRGESSLLNSPWRRLRYRSLCPSRYPSLLASELLSRRLTIEPLRPMTSTSLRSICSAIFFSRSSPILALISHSESLPTLSLSTIGITPSCKPLAPSNSSVSIRGFHWAPKQMIHMNCQYYEHPLL
ncbi:hypothetical protein EDB84DRAFT_1469316 [Lactarius hengduanensis]|nr:hypothetical protein EDB84DRAFT_1469316 [Lactarius hengduanensis]